MCPAPPPSGSARLSTTASRGNSPPGHDISGSTGPGFTSARCAAVVDAGMLTVSVPVDLGEIRPGAVRVELYAEPTSDQDVVVLQMTPVASIAVAPNAVHVHGVGADPSSCGGLHGPGGALAPRRVPAPGVAAHRLAAVTSGPSRTEATRTGPVAAGPGGRLGEASRPA